MQNHKFPQIADIMFKSNWSYSYWELQLNNLLNQSDMWRVGYIESPIVHLSMQLSVNGTPISTQSPSGTCFPAHVGRLWVFIITPHFMLFFYCFALIFSIFLAHKTLNYFFGTQRADEMCRKGRRESSKNFVCFRKRKPVQRGIMRFITDQEKCVIFSAGWNSPFLRKPSASHNPSKNQKSLCQS